ncbi:hypothetical protein ACJIZ3_022281 [Penstemon smallii]|uniref:C2H2-type domain-containing protein n=1 Tax=Penstemon smallii TaxID=265156 RepID=A0ABD3TLT1_9LAMI
MSAAKLVTSGTLNAMTSEEGNNSLDNFIRQAVVREPLLPFSRTGDSPVQWIQFLNALDQPPDIPGWPLMTHPKVLMQKCEKCSLEFCSPINYRRHVRVHRRSLNVNKESHKNRDLLAAFWDKLSLEEAKEVMSFKDVMLQEIPGSTVIGGLAASLHNPGFWSLQQSYVKAGSIMLDIIQAKPSRLPISSRELFSILDDASERTFLCAGTAESMQKYVFDGETARNSLELNNLVASTCFLFEHQLVKAWLADKDAEALRCQKLLVEEEEAAQKRQAELLERKKQKKLRQKEQKLKEQHYEQTGDLDGAVVAVDAPTSVEVSGLSSPSDSNLKSLDVPENLDSSLETMRLQSKELDGDSNLKSLDVPENLDSSLETMRLQSKELDGDIESDSNFNSLDVPENLDSSLESMLLQSKESDGDFKAQFDFSSEFNSQVDSQTIEPQIVGTDGNRQLTTRRRKAPKSQRDSRHGFHVGQNAQNLQALKPEPIRKLQSRSRSRVWTKKSKIESDSESLKTPCNQIEENNCQVIIGSIPVPLKNCVPQKQDESQDSCSKQTTTKKNNSSENLMKADNNVQSAAISQVETKKISPFDRVNEDSKGGVMLEKACEYDRIMSSETNTQLKSTNNDDFDNRISTSNDDFDNRISMSNDDDFDNRVSSSGNVQQGYLPFSSTAAKEFLDKRWREAISGDHVILHLSPSPGGSNVQQDDSTASHIDEGIVLGNDEKQVRKNAHGNKSRKMPEKSLKTKYIPKQKPDS